MMIDKDFLVIGSGIAGLTFALKASQFGSVAIVSKDELAESATLYAQGGIASVMTDDDSFELHANDTIESGRGLCRDDVVRIICREGPSYIRELIDLGVKFTRIQGEDYHLSREGGHSRDRILHANDLTGREIERAMIEAIRTRENITVFSHHMLIDFITLSRLDSKVKPGSSKDETIGAYILDVNTKQVKTFLSNITLLASGGAGKVYLYTSNPDTATGDGIAAAYRAGGKIANMEFIQFHPTCLYHPQAKSFLISETVRGEGGILRLKSGRTFMENYHSIGCLAPRDIVARAIDHEMKKSGDDCVYLDITHIEGYRIRERFPNIYQTCLQFGIDIVNEPIPVVPAAHYTCGGVLVDLNGQTNIRHLFASGEVCYSGLHGANRLASNSLLEGLVLSNRAVSKAASLLKSESFNKTTPHNVPSWDFGNAVDSDESVVVSHNWDEIRRIMWNYVGIVRSDKRLCRAERRVQLLLDEIKEYYWNFKITKNTLELRNIALTAHLIIMSALQRKESRGLHFTLDYPKACDSNWKKDTILQDTTRRLANQTSIMKNIS